MKREIKFMAYHHADKKMYEVSTLISKFNDEEFNRVYLKGRDLVYGEPTNFLADGKNVSLMQFTGLLDKKGKEIYEGDIISYNRGYADDSIHDLWQRRNYVIKFSRGQFFPYDIKHRTRLGFAAINESDLVMKSYEIIGNIYQNPELLTP